MNILALIKQQFVRIQKGTSLRLSHINPPCDANFGEALATLLAAFLSVSLKLQKFNVEGDSLTIITALQYPSITQD